jgi:hypothetical protein
LPEAPEPSRPSRRRWLAGTAVVVVVGALVAGAIALLAGGSGRERGAGSGCEPSGGAANPADDAGFAAGAGLPERSDADLRRDLDGMAATGAAYLRFDLPWSSIEEQPGQFRWGEFDRVVDAAHACGLEVVGLLAYSPEWARPPGSSEHAPPLVPDDFAAFVTEAVRRYAPRGVDTWEIWNEPNMDLFWGGAPDPAAYTELLIAAYDAAKAVDADATVVSGGLAPVTDAPDGDTISPATFVEGMYAAGAGGHFDALGHHPYSFPMLPNDDEDTAFRQTPLLHELMEENGDGAKLIWGTEFGVPTGSAGFPTTFVAESATVGYDVWRAWPFTGPLLWYSYRDAGSDRNDPEDNFGLVTADYHRKEPALSAFEAAIR